jgi:formylglycine-generating enzyme required for sulfatase activity
LGYLHGKNRLHLDIKPVNIRLSPGGRLFLVDSGLPGLGINIGTSGYSSPEQQKQSSVEVTSDIYSLGATLYTVVTGRVPPAALHRESGLEDLVPAREVKAELEPYLSVMISRSMDLRPDVRFESAEEFANALKSGVVQSKPDSEQPRRTETAKPTTPPPRLPERKRKKIEQRTILGLAALVLIFGGIIIGLLLASRTPEAREAQAAATVTLESQVIAALTAITTVTPSPAPSATLLPTPAPWVDELTGKRMIYVPGGIFRMGNDEAEDDESPSHLIRVDSYFIDETEVTNGEYAVCVDDGECDPPSNLGATYHQEYFGSDQFNNYPVIFVDWNSAQNFCSWRGARLPSEAEWERAAGFDPLMGIRQLYPWGDVFDGTLLNFCDVNCPQEDRDFSVDDNHRDTAPVGSYPQGRSPLGLLDMAGNVMEWVSDWYDPNYYEVAPDTNPLGPLEGDFKTVRGGSWLSSQDTVRVTGRGSYDPSVRRAHLGFRCALTAP